MKKFPILKKYSTDELIVIIYSDKDQWQKEAIKYAKNILIERDVDELESEKQFKELEIESEDLWKKELEYRRSDSYNPLELVLMVVFWFNFISQDWNLNKYGYSKRRKQRFFAIGSGVIIYFLLIGNLIPSKLEFDQDKQVRIKYIDSLAHVDSIRKSKIDWSGTYIFLDSNLQFGNKQQFEWKLIIKKDTINHKGEIYIKNNNINFRINCVGLLKDDRIEFYPDTTYLLFERFEIYYYDKLFTFVNHKGDLYTHWGKIKPFYSSAENGIKKFRKSN